MSEHDKFPGSISVHRSAALLFAAALALGGCSRRDEATVGTPGNPLLVILSPAHSPASSPGALDHLKAHLEKATGMTVDLKAAASAAETVKSFDSDRTDAGLVTLEEYLVARAEYGVRPELQALRGDKLAEYEGAILTRAAGGAGAVAELAGRKVGFVGPYSVSGFTLPVIYLKKAGVAVTADYSAGHEAVLKKLVDGEIYAAATYARQASRKPGLKILAFTGKVPNEPLVVRKGLAPEKRKALSAAFLAIAGTSEGRRALGAVADISGFRPADEAAYKPLHDLLLSEGKSVYDLVPEGWDIRRLSEPYYPD
ncbi:MAG: phosphate/phosphite/phosphonate ABC transporter substrate-binding protein [Elusimicrobia bacterium]|nr:phosphate/phosphite/phosphonate ABC transporter substrate-binding protein [Elusimicrobiota bacterium]